MLFLDIVLFFKLLSCRPVNTVLMSKQERKVRWTESQPKQNPTEKSTNVLQTSKPGLGRPIRGYGVTSIPLSLDFCDVFHVVES